MLCHISHVYETGASLYFTVAAKQTDDPVAQWLAAKAAASDAMIDNGASITHHHAVGQDHKPWLAREIGPVGVQMLRALKAGARPDRGAQPRRAHPLKRPHQQLAVDLGGDRPAAFVDEAGGVAGLEEPLAEHHLPPWRRRRAVAPPRAGRVAARVASVGHVQRRTARGEGYDASPSPRPRGSSRRRAVDRGGQVVGLETRLVGPHPRLHEPRLLRRRRPPRSAPRRCRPRAAAPGPDRSPRSRPSRCAAALH